MRGFAWSRSRIFQRANGVSERPVGGLVKRGFDIGGATFALVVLSPLILLLACLIAFADGGPVFQSHHRIGRGGCVFNCLRFRTTFEGAGGSAATPVHLAQGAGIDPGGIQAFGYDPHATAVGAVLMRLGLAELPQLINIARGDMSIVGPRPVPPGAVEILGSAAELYLNARPGLTGPWRLGASDEVSYASQLTCAENWSLLWDLHIVVRSVCAVCRVAAEYRRLPG